MASTAWLRENGWWVTPGTDARPTHLMLDGGKARVPDDAAGAFLSAYALAVVRKLHPCVVELRTPVFRMFLDLDLKFQPPLDFDRVMLVVQRRAAAFFAEDSPRAVVCATQPRCDDGVTKSGKHVVWTNVWATSATALGFRDALVADLDVELPGACVKPWATVVDACVFTSNGLRMPFSEKGRGNTAVYFPAQVWQGECPEEVPEVSGVATVRHWSRELSIRAFGVDETPVRPGVVVAAVEANDLRGTSRSVKEYEAALEGLDAALPVQFAGQRVTGVIKAESCFLMRSSSRYCLNLGRAHNSCGIYWILTLKGVRQGCYCRCDTLEGRRYGLCRDFKSEVFPVPEEVLRAFFGAPPPPGAPPAAVLTKFQPSPMPSARAATAATDLLGRCRPPLVPPKRRKRKVT